jgi:hypothetical protein
MIYAYVNFFLEIPGNSGTVCIYQAILGQAEVLLVRPPIPQIFTDYIEKAKGALDFQAGFFFLI